MDPSGSAFGLPPEDTTVTGALRITSVPSVPGSSWPRTAAATRSRSAGRSVATTSSMGPSWVRAESRTEAPRLSPTMNEAVMIAVPSSDPATTRRASPRRRPTLRSASRRSVGRRIPS